MRTVAWCRGAATRGLPVGLIAVVERRVLVPSYPEVFDPREQIQSIRHKGCWLLREPSAASLAGWSSRPDGDFRPPPSNRSHRHEPINLVIPHRTYRRSIGNRSIESPSPDRAGRRHRRAIQLAGRTIDATGTSLVEFLHQRVHHVVDRPLNAGPRGVVLDTSAARCRCRFGPRPGWLSTVGLGPSRK